MAVQRNIFFRHVDIYDRQLEISHALSGQPECYIRRTSYDDIWYHNGLPTDRDHPTLSYVYSNHNYTNFFINGIMRFEWSWTSEENYTEAQLDSYISLVDNSHTTFSKDLPNKTLTATVNVGDVQYSDWSERLFNWNLKSPVFKMTMVSEDTEYVCITPLSDTMAYSHRLKTVQPGESVFTEKLGTECYVLFTSELSKGELTLNGLQLYKLSSGNITLTNNGATAVKIIKVYK
jgi:hypothetical protein